VSAKPRVVLADDHPVVLAGLRSLIQADPEIEFVGEATTGLAALSLVREKRPDVAVVDLSMPGLNGIGLAKRLREEFPSVRVVILTLQEERAYVNQALQAGVRGYALKRSALENLIHAIRAVSAGGLYLDPAIAGLVIDPARRGNGASLENSDASELSGREAEVLKRTALGQTNKEIAHHLDVGVKSVETYKARAAEKLGLATRADIVRYASAQGWLADL
jgi:DNA-binding NarL/FixJ family response regulator